MRRARLENRPRIPHCLKDLDKILRQRQYRALSKVGHKDSIYAGRAGSSRRKTISLIFVSKRMLKYMNKQKISTIFCDATFCPVPRGLRAYQV